MTEWLRERMLDFLQIQEAPKGSYQIEEKFDFASTALKNRLWYRGEANELDSFFRGASMSTVPFWGAQSSNGMAVRKIHTGVPRIIVNTLVNIVLADLHEIVLEDETQAELWAQIADENKFDDLADRALKDALAIGDGAFKVSFDKAISELPIIEFYSAEKIEPLYVRGRLREIVFKTIYHRKRKKYVLNEHYGFGYVTYKLYEDDKPVSLSALPETADLEDVKFSDQIMMAELYIISESDKFPGRGSSIFDGKTDPFDALDESWSQWMDALRKGRAVKYIPDALLPRNPVNGAVLRPNAFDNDYIATDSNMQEGAHNEVKLVQPAIPTDNYMQTYITSLDLALQGIVSPSTLGIDVKKLDNAEAQREKEKATLYTRAAIVESLQKLIPRVVRMALQSYWAFHTKSSSEVICTVSFGEYATPSFESLVETLSNPSTPMSIEARVDEMWGDSRTPEWKEEEVLRIKQEAGIITAEEPALEDEF